MAAWGVLKPAEYGLGPLCEEARMARWGAVGELLTKSNLLVEPDAGRGLLGLELLGVKENSVLLLESLLSLNVGHCGGVIKISSAIK